MYTGIRLLLLICHINSSLFFFSKFQIFKFSITLLSGNVRPRRLKLGTHMDSGWMNRVYWNQAVAAYSSLYFFLLLSLQFFKHLKFLSLFSPGTVRPRNIVHAWTVGICILYTGIGLLLLICPFIQFSFLQFSSIKNFRHTFLRNFEV